MCFSHVFVCHMRHTCSIGWPHRELFMVTQGALVVFKSRTQTSNCQVGWLPGGLSFNVSSAPGICHGCLTPRLGVFVACLNHHQHCCRGQPAHDTKRLVTSLRLRGSRDFGHHRCSAAQVQGRQAFWSSVFLSCDSSVVIHLHQVGGITIRPCQGRKHVEVCAM